MNGFVRTLIFAMALLGMLLVGGLVALLFLLSQDDSWREAARKALLSDKEQNLLSEAATRAAEPPRLPPPSSTDMERLTADIADQLGKGQIRQLVEELRTKQAAVEDVRANLQRDEAEIRLARADLLRVQRQIQEEKRLLAEDRQAQQAKHERWAEANANSLKAIKQLDEFERRRYGELAKVYEAMRDDAWLQLRQMDADEIARILNFMPEKKAAAIMALAVADLDYPGMSMEIHRALLSLDPDAETGSQIERLAGLYSFMQAPTVLTHLEKSKATEVAAILMAMQADSPRLVGDVLEALRRGNDPRELQVRELLHNPQANGRGG